MFVANMLDWSDEAKTFLMTTDADLWPLKKAPYKMAEDKEIISVNSECCGTFKRDGEPYKMLPIGNIGMSVATWKEVMNTNLRTTNKESVLASIKSVFLSKTSHKVSSSSTMQTSANCSAAILWQLAQEYGDNVYKHVEKGSDAWYYDQLTVSVRIKRWWLKNGIDKVQFVPRYTYIDRVDRAGWSLVDYETKKDAHLLLKPYTDSNWYKIKVLLKKLFSKREVKRWSKYWTRFLKKLKMSGKKI